MIESIDITKEQFNTFKDKAYLIIEQKYRSLLIFDNFFLIYNYDEKDFKEKEESLTT
jgi:hypothetical protein